MKGQHKQAALHIACALLFGLIWVRVSASAPIILREGGSPVEYQGETSVLRPASAAISSPPTEPFLYPPYYLTHTVTAVFDHACPKYDDEDTDRRCRSEHSNYVMHFNGVEFNKEDRDISLNACWLPPYCYTGHNGIDYDLPDGTEVLAAADGEVLYAGPAEQNREESAYGNIVKIDHNNGYLTLYAHLRSVYTDVTTELP